MVQVMINRDSEVEIQDSDSEQLNESARVHLAIEEVCKAAHKY